MIAKLAKICFFLISILFLIYVSIPEPQFPEPLKGSFQSQEPSDVETPLRRGYFTNKFRNEVMNHYRTHFGWGIRLNYPPEESQKLIRDQTKSTYLEEIVHPFRESLFVSGYETREDEGEFVKDGKPWKNKVIVKFVRSNFLTRISVVFVTLFAFWFLVREWVYEIGKFKK